MVRTLIGKPSMPPLTHMIGLSIGGMIGTLCRYGLAQWGATMVPLGFWRGFFVGTFTANILGCLLMGLLLALFDRNVTWHPALRLALTTGFLGALTTFSTWQWELVSLWRQGSIGLSAVYWLSSSAFGFLAALLGFMLVGWMFPVKS